jgi:hypothetical protein
MDVNIIAEKLCAKVVRSSIKKNKKFSMDVNVLTDKWNREFYILTPNL